ncbi:unnamed protein product [Orchesella dallaii]|uniref:adenylate cyclase n=1 Tax=Orchesella dallaii TaxID=48710 RepID=A0ABP1QKC5_9HEXA
MERLSVDNISFLARNSMSLSPKRASQVSLLAEAQSDSVHHLDDRNWSWEYLRNRFRIDDLEELYDRYFLRIQNSYFNVYLVMQVILSALYIMILLYFSLVHDNLLDTKYYELCGANVTVPKHIRCDVEHAVYLALPEIITHGIILISCAIMYLLVYNETLFRREPHGRKIQIALSVFTCFTVLLPDVGLSIFYYVYIDVIRTPLAFQTIILIYFFLPLPKKYQAVILGLFSSTVHLITSGILHKLDGGYTEGDAVRRVFAELIFYLCGNAVGVYSQLMNEVTIRRAFMDRRGYIKSTIKKNYEKDQEEQLLASILPDHISTLVKEELRSAIGEYEEESAKQQARKRSNVSDISTLGRSPGGPQNHGVKHKKPFSELFIERHENVSIIFADIVNFTPLTVKLRADELVETLNELFGKFDAAATKHNCTRIKLLGDCYYAVSGLQNQTPDHASNCVLFGFDMIEIIKEVRDALKVDINMRIGIHSGNILSGLLGIYGWQFDIYGKNVTISNHMEQSGQPGKVHVTKQTKEFLGTELANMCKPTKSKDKYLEENSIETFLLTPAMSPQNCQSPVSSPTSKMPLHSVGSHDGEDEDSLTDLGAPRYVRGITNFSGSAITPRRNNSIAGTGTADLIRKKSIRVGSFVAGSSDVLRYREMMGQVNETMKHAIDDMPLRKFDVYCGGRKDHEHKNSINVHVNPILMNFDELTSEIHYQTQPDPLFKYYVGCALFVLLCIGILQVIAVPQQHSILWFILAAGCTFLLILIPFVWVGYLWTQIKDPHRELDVIPLPQNRLVRLLFHSSNRITGSCLRRTLLYFVIAMLISFFAIIDVIECDTGSEMDDCKSPWYYTYSCALAILVTYSFFRIHFLLKVIICIVALAGYSLTIFFYRKYVFELNRGGSPGLSGVGHDVFSHVIYLLGIGAMLHVMDRQMEYINRLDFIWKKRLTEEHKEATLTHAVNTVLIHNILPTQIAKIYLDPNRTGESHSRTYQNVSVMFASIPKFMDFFSDDDLSRNGIRGLDVLNQIISEFDKALFNHLDVEKIKVIGSTYMAACGLEVQETGRLSATSMIPVDSEYIPSWKNQDGVRTSVNPIKRQKTLHTLVKFAADMMLRLQSINSDTGLDFQLRVGVSTGLVVAGVVGSQKPLYDTWGDSVNLASRMESNGSPNKIQVSAYCASLLSQAHVRCEQRGNIFVKGKGNMITYYVMLDDSFRIMYDYEEFEESEAENHCTDL